MGFLDLDVCVRDVRIGRMDPDDYLKRFGPQLRKMLANGQVDEVSWYADRVLAAPRLRKKR